MFECYVSCFNIRFLFRIRLLSIIAVNFVNGFKISLALISDFEMHIDILINLIFSLTFNRFFCLKINLNHGCVFYAKDIYKSLKGHLYLIVKI